MAVSITQISLDKVEDWADEKHEEGRRMKAEKEEFERQQKELDGRSGT